jgi:cyclopropane fatty-acyl-phospholipid synthase-like methyltransferase
MMSTFSSTSDSSCFLCGSIKIEKLFMGDIMVLKCGSCDFQNIPNSKDILGEDWFEKYYENDRKSDTKKNNDREKQYKVDANFLTEYLNDDSFLLDVGCSHGGFISAIHELGSGINMHGIDIDPSAIEEANQRYSEIADFDEIDLLELNPKNEYDIVTFRGTLQYLNQNLHGSLDHIKNILNMNSKIVIFSLPSTDSFIYYLMREKWPLFHPEMSLMFNEKSIKTLASIHNFKIERLEYPYINEVYSNRNSDYEKVIEMIRKEDYENSVPFIGSIMTVVLSKL